MKNLKSYIEEGLLRGMDSTLSAGQESVDAVMNIDTIPIKNDFQKNPWNKDWQGVAWYCPDVLAKYKKLYPNFIKPEMNTLWFVLDKYGRVVDFILMFGDSQSVTCKKQAIWGWNDGFVGATLAKYKGFVINFINKIAKNPEKLDTLMKYANEVHDAYYKSTEYKETKSLMSL